MTGLDLLRRMRANHIALPAIIITTNPRPSLQARAAALHAIVVEKPLLGDALITAVDEALDAAKRKMPR